MPRGIKQNEIRYICDQCAIKNGAMWPKGLQATFHTNICDCCHKTNSLCSVADWNWPKGLPKNFSLSAGRD